jgi:DNA helicase-2/ATP-dependent DNA helicase PcrA
MAYSSDKQLNTEQLEAIKHGDGPLLIVAGAGTGKTTVITERVKYLIENSLAQASEILALTFTEKASREMEERIDEALPYGFTQMWISTFHAFCERILKAEGLHIGLDSRFKLMNTAETIQLVKNNLFNFDLDYFRPLGNPTKFISAILQHFSRLQDEDITPDQYLEWINKKVKENKDLSEEEQIENKKWLELASTYKKYDELKIENGLMDYGDLITKVLILFRQRPNILEKYKQQFKYILVDEFQDTNISQYDLIKLLAPPDKNSNLTVVGDDSQSIYKFRGAAISNIIQFKDDYKNAKTIVLTKNYRSTQKILDASYRLIKHNDPDTLEAKLGIDKNLISQKEGKQFEIEFLHLPRVENEAEEVANKIVELSKDYDYKDFAILVRANNHAEPFTRALNRNGIPNQFLGPAKLFKQPEIIDLIAYLKVLVNFEDSISLYRLLSSSLINISGMDLAILGNFARKNNQSLFSVCQKISDLEVTKETKEKINKLVETITKHLDDVKRMSAGQILYDFLNEQELFTKLLNPENSEAERKAQNIAKFFDKLKGYETEHEDANVFVIVEWIDLLMDLGESPLASDTDWSEENAVNILTIHGSKGLEFPVVFLVNMVSQRFPSMERKETLPIPDELIKEYLPEGEAHLQEERRLAYVGITRAKERLYLTAANFYGDGKRDKKISPFVLEALSEDLNKLKELKSIKKGISGFTVSKKEKIDEKKKELSINYLSYSQIETFRVCPLHYKLNYLIKVPTPPSASQSFGISIHAAMKDFYALVINGEKPSEKLIQEQLKKNWINLGFENKAHEQKFFEKGKLYLLGYLKEEFKQKQLPILMEEKFTVPIETERSLKIGGVIDRVDKLEDGSIEIIDYKTSANIPTQKEVDKNLQLSFYALAATNIDSELFGKLPEQVKLSLYFFDQQIKLTTIKTKEDLQKAQEEILQVREEIENSDFECSGGFLCQNCEFKMFCKSE